MSERGIEGEGREEGGGGRRGQTWRERKWGEQAHYSALSRPVDGSRAKWIRWSDGGGGGGGGDVYEPCPTDLVKVFLITAYYMLYTYIFT